MKDGDKLAIACCDWSDEGGVFFPSCSLLDSVGVKHSHNATTWRTRPAKTNLF